METIDSGKVMNRLYYKNIWTVIHIQRCAYLPRCRLESKFNRVLDKFYPYNVVQILSVVNPEGII